MDQALHLIMLGIIERPAGFSSLAARKRWSSNGKNKTLLEVLWILGEHVKYMKLCKARVDWIFERIVRGGDGGVREEIKRLRGWVDKLDVGSGGHMASSGAMRQLGLDM